MFWSLKPIILKSKTYHFADQNNLFCSSDVSDDTKKFVTSTDKLVINGLNSKVLCRCVQTPRNKDECTKQYVISYHIQKLFYHNFSRFTAFGMFNVKTFIWFCHGCATQSIIYGGNIVASYFCNAGIDGFAC